MKVVINNCHGGFGLSNAGIARYLEIKGLKMSDDFYDRDIPRNDTALVQVVEELQKLAYGKYADLRILDIPDGVDWEIDEYDGNEWVAEVHRTWS